MLFILLLFRLIQSKEFFDNKNEIKNDHDNTTEDDVSQSINADQNLGQNSTLISNKNDESELVNQENNISIEIPEKKDKFDKTSQFTKHDKSNAESKAIENQEMNETKTIKNGTKDNESKKKDIKAEANNNEEQKKQIEKPISVNKTQTKNKPNKNSTKSSHIQNTKPLNSQNQLNSSKQNIQNNEKSQNLVTDNQNKEKVVNEENFHQHTKGKNLNETNSNESKNTTSKKLYNRFSRENQRKSILFKRTKSRNGQQQPDANETNYLQPNFNETKSLHSNREKIVRRPILNEIHKKHNISSKIANKRQQNQRKLDKNVDSDKNIEKIRAGLEILKMKDQMQNQKETNDNGEAQRKKIAGILDFIKEKYAPSRTPVPHMSIGSILIFGFIGTVVVVVIYLLCCRLHKKSVPKKMNDEQMPFKMANFNQEEKELAAHGFSQV